ncbi:hypothetical protein B296_00031779 [Ensete ventricosum]|uniref:Uncharacterized protein n=1 Tax=Ensete ventricosum TaxID=4639 RepID=A0A426XMQ1_ENSVE|nr:hypothetical protein B296_00031779 [Ensete ventricosum]
MGLRPLAHYKQHKPASPLDHPIELPHRLTHADLLCSLDKDPIPVAWGALVFNADHCFGMMTTVFACMVEPAPRFCNPSLLCPLLLLYPLPLFVGLLYCTCYICRPALLPPLPKQSAQHVDVIAALPLLHVATATLSFSLPTSYGVPPLFVASVTHHRRLLPLLLHLHKQRPPLYQTTAHHHPLASSGTSVATFPAHRAVSSSLHICANSSLQHLLLLWLPADLPQLTICVLALSTLTPSLFNSSFNPTPLVVSKTAHTSTSLHLSTSASRPTS